MLIPFLTQSESKNHPFHYLLQIRRIFTIETVNLPDLTKKSRQILSFCQDFFPFLFFPSASDFLSHKSNIGTSKSRCHQRQYSDQIRPYQQQTLSKRQIP